MAILSKAIYRFNEIPIKSPMSFFTELERIIQKFMWGHKIPRIAKAILKTNKQQQKRTGSITLPDFRQYCKVTVINSVVLVQKQTYKQWNRIESPEISQDTYGQLILNKGGKNIKWKKTISSASGAGKTGQLHIN